ncbi:MAG: NADH-quinone oxidoreductase subunit J [bacterium]
MRAFVYSAAFYFIAFFTVISALGVIVSRRIIYSAMSLVACFFSIAGIYFLLGADFAGVSQIIIYSVGLTIVLLFAIMMTARASDEKLWIAFVPRSLIGFMSAGLMFLVLFFSITTGFSSLKRTPDNIVLKQRSPQTLAVVKEEGTAGIIGSQLFSKYLLPFEILSVLLLAAILGAVVIATKDDQLLENPSAKKEEV